MATDELLKLVIVRHGTTESNLKGLMVGNIDDPLTEDSKWEIGEMVAQYPYPEVGLVFRSPMRRCLETMEIVCPGCEATILEGLHEIEFGDYEGRKLSDVLQVIDQNAFMERAPHFKFPGGESMEGAGRRICAAMDSIIRAARGAGCRSVGIFTHSLVMDVFLHNHVQPLLTPEQLFFPNGYGMELWVDLPLWQKEGLVQYGRLLPQDAPRPPLAESPFAHLYKNDG